jgi:hypothetical protein
MKTSTRTDREGFVMQAVLKQLELAGVDPKVLKEDPTWFSNNTISAELHEEWKSWFISQVRKRFKYNKKFAEREFSFFNLNYGLKLKSNESSTK